MARDRKTEEPAAERAEGDAAPNAVWFKPVMIGFMLLGLAWILVF
ncbi:cell division protein CrgA, partial [Mycobacterium tuberculosis]